MKVYAFFLHDKEINGNVYCGAIPNIKKYDEIRDEEYVIYAYTPDKKVAKLFRETRDMNKFREEEIEMNKEDYNDMVDNHEHLSRLVLSYHLFKTQTSEDGCYKLDVTTILCTSKEYDYILFNFKNKLTSMLMDKTNDLFDINFVFIFTERIRDLLVDDLQFYQALDTFGLSLEDIPFDELNIDMVTAFCESFQNIYK